MAPAWCDCAVLPLHIGVNSPSHWDDIEARQREAGDRAAPYLRDQRRPALAIDDPAWAERGIDVRWIGDDTVDCVVTLEPGAYHGKGAGEYERFVLGAKQRGELAISVTTPSETDGSMVPVYSNIFGGGSTIHLGGWNSYVSASLLGKNSRVQLAENLRGADRDLALRLVGEDLQWSTLELQGSTEYPGGGGQARVYAPQGHLDPVLITPLGEPVVAAWVSPDAAERMYVVPRNIEWDALRDWLLDQALPELNPASLRRHRMLKTAPPELQTTAEREADAALNVFDAEVAERRAELVQAQTVARDAAHGMRDGLLYGRGHDLEAAVARAISEAGIQVQQLDIELGEPASADLLCTLGDRSVLVEVKSVGGNASESLYAALVKHVDAWQAHPNRPAIDGGVLVVNHEHKKDPADRSPSPYLRRSFLESQLYPVVTAVQLFDAWRTGDWTNIRALVFDGERAAVPSRKLSPAPTAAERATDGGDRKRMWWSRGPR